MKQSLVGYSVLGAVAFLLFLLWLAPAGLVTEQISTHLPGFTVQHAAGTAVNGMAADLRWRAGQIDQLHWRWHPWRLLTGRLAFGLRAEDPQIKLLTDAALSWNRQLHFRGLTGQLAVAEASKWAGLPDVPLVGTADLRLDTLTFDAAGYPIAAHGLIQLSQLRIDWGQTLPLGDYLIQLDTPSAAGIEAKLSDNNAALQLTGTLRLLPNGQYQLTGQAAIRDPNNHSLHQAMNVLGPPDSNGHWSLNFSGALPW